METSLLARGLNELRKSLQEFMRSARRMRWRSGVIAGFVVVGIGGVLAILAFSVIGLGQLLGDRYWLSALLVGVSATAVGFSGAYLNYKEGVEKDLALPTSRSLLTVAERALEVVERQPISDWGMVILATGAIGYVIGRHRPAGMSMTLRSGLESAGAPASGHVNLPH